MEQSPTLFFPKDFRLRHIVTVSVILVGIGILAEVTQYLDSSVLKRVILPIVVGLLVGACLFPLVVTLTKRLTTVIGGSTTARFQDLILIGFTYMSVIIAFGIIYQMLEYSAGKEVFAFSPFRTKLRLIDNLYVSGITITTVGYGDVTPTFWFTKLLVVVESLVGILLTATVLGLFIGSLLSSQQQDQQRRWYAGLQRRYLQALNEYFDTINSIDTKVDIGELKKKTLSIRQGLLKTIASLVQAQYAPAPSAKVCANWMRLHTALDAERKYLDLAEPYTFPLLRGEAMRSLWGILILREWGEQPPNMPGSGELVLPVYDPADPAKIRSQLSGAPHAITNRDGYHIVSDTRSIDLSNQDPDVRNRMESYFAEHSNELRSFASVRIEYSGRVVGVVNIQSSEPDLCGTTEYVQRTIVDMIRPFTRYLARLAVYDEAKEKEQKQQ